MRKPAMAETDGRGEVVVTHPETLSPKEARALAKSLQQRADEADREINSRLTGTAMTNRDIARLIVADYHLFVHSGTLGKDRVLDTVTDALDAYSVEKDRQENVDNMRRALDSYHQCGRAVEEVVDAVLHAPYLAAIAGLRAQLVSK